MPWGLMWYIGEGWRGGGDGDGASGKGSTSR